jgi:hypothetical protein
MNLYSLISTAQEQPCAREHQNRTRPAQLFTVLPGDDAVQARTDSLAKLLKEKTEYVKRAYWKEDRHDPDLR